MFCCFYRYHLSSLLSGRCTGAVTREHGAGAISTPALSRARARPPRRSSRTARRRRRPACTTCCTASITLWLPVRPSFVMPPPLAVDEHPADRAVGDALGEPVDADLALAAGEAAERGDVGARCIARRARARLARDRDRAAAVRLDVGDRRRQRLRCRRTCRRHRPGAPPPPGRRSGRRSRHRPPPAAAAEARGRGPPAGNVPLVAWPSVCTDHVAGRDSSARERRRRARPCAPARRRRGRERRRGDAPRRRPDRREPRRAARRARARRARSPRRATTAAGASTARPCRRPASCADARADQRGRERREQRDVVRVEDALRRS